MFDAGLERQIEIAKRHREFPEPLADAVRGHGSVVRDSPVPAARFGTKEALYLAELADEVQTELSGLVSRLRFEINPHGILYAKASPIHGIEELVVEHFARQFPYFIVLESARGTFVCRDGVVERFSEPLSAVLASLEQVLPFHPILSRLESRDKEIWESFRNSLHEQAQQLDAERPKQNRLKQAEPASSYGLRQPSGLKAEDFRAHLPLRFATERPRSLQAFFGKAS